MKRSAALVLLSAGLAGAAAGGPAPAPERVDVQVTSDLSTGSLDEPSGVPVRDTTLRLRYRGDGWTGQAELPSLRVAGVRDGAPRRPGERSVDHGAGDARLKLTLSLHAPDPAATRLDLVFRAKSGTGQAVGGIETGDAGQSVRLEMQRSAGAWKLFGDLGWRRAGNLPGFEVGRHALVGEIGLARSVSPRLEVGGMLDVRQRMSTDAALRDATLYATLKEDGGRRWMLHVGASMAPSITDRWAGISYRARF